MTDVRRAERRERTMNETAYDLLASDDRSAEDVADALQQLTAEALDDGTDYASPAAQLVSFREGGYLTSDAGFVLSLPGGEEFQVTVVRSR
jgi:hypothetical protein